MPPTMQSLQRADRLLGGPALALCALLGRMPGRRRGERPPRRVLLVKFWGLGSLQLLTPAVRALRRRHPEARLELLTLARNAPFARGLGVFDEVLQLDVTGASWTRLFGRIRRLLRRLRHRRYDAAYDFEFFARFSAVVCVLSGAPATHGFWSPESRRGGVHASRVPFNRYWHVARNFRLLSGGEDGRPVSPAELAPLPVRPAERSEAAARLFERGFAARGPLVVLNPNAGSLSLERRWPAERFALLAKRLVREDGARVALVGAPGEEERGREVVGRAGALPSGRIADLTGALSIGALAALLDEADLFVTNDSGPMHVAAARGVATVGLFGPETPIMYAPLGERTRWLYAPPPCSPCINVHDNKLAVCVRGRAECLTNLSVDVVLAAARRELALLGRSRAPRDLATG